MTQSINQTSSDFNQDQISDSPSVSTLASNATSTTAVVEAAVLHAVLLSCASIASKQDADLNSANMASISASSEETSETEATQTNQSNNADSINNLFQDKADPMEADYKQYVEISEELGQEEDMLQKLIAMSYTMKNSFYICELMYNALGDAKGEQGAQYGALNNIDTAMGNANANAQNQLNDAVKFLEQNMSAQASAGADATTLLNYDLNKLVFDCGQSQFSPQTFSADWSKFQTDMTNANLPSSITSSSTFQKDVAAMSALASQIDGNNFNSQTVSQFMSAGMQTISDIYTITEQGNPNPPSAKVMADLNTIIADSGTNNFSKTEADLQTLATDVANDTNLSASTIQALTQGGLSGTGMIGDLIAELKSGYGTAPPMVAFSAIFRTIVTNGSFNPNQAPPASPPPPNNQKQIDAYLAQFAQQVDQLHDFITKHSHLFGDGGGDTILQQIATIKSTFANGGTWGNGDSMRGMVNIWLSQANQQGVAPQQLQTLSGAVQSIDRATDAQSTSSRMSADYDLNVDKQILGGQESFVQAPLQAENGFVHNQKAQ